MNFANATIKLKYNRANEEGFRLEDKKINIAYYTLLSVTRPSSFAVCRRQLEEDIGWYTFYRCYHKLVPALAHTLRCTSTLPVRSVAPRTWNRNDICFQRSPRLNRSRDSKRWWNNVIKKYEYRQGFFQFSGSHRMKDGRCNKSVVSGLQKRIVWSW